MLYVNLLSYNKRRYFWVALAVIIVSALIYASQDASLPPNGGSWQGYVLGTAGALLICWLTWLGIRKRSWNKGSGALEGWASAHVYLGLALVFVATFHTGFQLGINIHTLAYVLMMIVIVSGIYGLYAYMNYPEHLARNRANQSFDAWMIELDKVDKTIAVASEKCDAEVQNVVSSAVARTTIGGGLLDHLRTRDNSMVEIPGNSGPARLLHNRNQQTVIDFLVSKIPDTSKAGEVDHLRSLLYAFGRRADILQRLRKELGLLAKLKIWLSVHIPVTVALIVALAAHIFSVFFYW